MTKPNPTIAAEYNRLRKLSKQELIASYPSRLDLSHMKSEPKSIIISGHLEARFGRRVLEAWNGRN